jgi:lactoylglutathione lyase
MAQNIAIERVDHIGVRVRNLDRALGFYRVLRFAVMRRAEGDDVAIIRNEHGVELNLVFNANAGETATNILMDVRDKYPGYTHIALRVTSIPETVAALNENGLRSPRDQSALARGGRFRCSCATLIATLSSCAAASRA